VDSGQINSEIALRQMLDKVGTSAKPDPVASAPGEVLQSFGEILKDNLYKVNQLQTEAAQVTQVYATGGPVELHQVMIATEKAELALELTMQVRNKMLQAYQEITRMGV
jgi:flagellar hook-basal body complex protein FliE